MSPQYIHIFIIKELIIIDVKLFNMAFEVNEYHVTVIWITPICGTAIGTFLDDVAWVDV